MTIDTWGGVKFKHSFPADGEYQITLTNLAVGPYSNALERENTVVILIDGRTVFRQPAARRRPTAGPICSTESRLPDRSSLPACR